MCTSGVDNNPESLLDAILDDQGVEGIARESVDYYITSVSTFSCLENLFLIKI